LVEVLTQKLETCFWFLICFFLWNSTLFALLFWFVVNDFSVPSHLVSTSWRNVDNFQCKLLGGLQYCNNPSSTVFILWCQFSASLWYFTVGLHYAYSIQIELLNVWLHFPVELVSVLHFYFFPDDVWCIDVPWNFVPFHIPCNWFLFIWSQSGLSFGVVELVLIWISLISWSLCVGFTRVGFCWLVVLL